VLFYQAPAERARLKDRVFFSFFLLECKILVRAIKSANISRLFSFYRFYTKVIALLRPFATVLTLFSSKERENNSEFSFVKIFRAFYEPLCDYLLIIWLI
jgi:hypothetical protein